MKLEMSRSALRDYSELDDFVRLQTDSALETLSSNIRYPGLRVKKLKGRRGIWEARINRKHRIIFKIQSDKYLILRLGPHDIEDAV